MIYTGFYRRIFLTMLWIYFFTISTFNDFMNFLLLKDPVGKKSF